MNRWRALASLTAALGLYLAAPPVLAIPLVGDQTIVLLTSAPTLAGAGITLSGTGTAVLGTDLAGRPEALFPITGGDVDETTLSGTIEHEGSGVLLTNGGGSSLAVANPLFDLDALTVTGDVSVNGGPSNSIGLFELAQCADLYGTAAQCLDGDGSTLLDGWKLTDTQELNDLLTGTFGIPTAPGSYAGVARIDILPVPEPTVAVLLGAGLVAAAVLHRKHAPR